MQTALALRQAVWRKADPAWQVCGLPAVLYSDHGGDFTSDHIAQVCADVKVQLVHSTQGRPRGRGKVERLFGTITTELLPALPGHIPPGNHGKPVTEPALTVSQLDAAVGRYIVDTYHQRVHPEIGQPPAGRWAAGDWLPRMPVSVEALDLLLLTMATPGHDPDLHARLRPAARPLSAALQPDRVRSSVPTLGPRRLSR